METPRQQLHVFYSGTVQGVGFRYTVRRLARSFAVTGAVRNLPDGRVEMWAEGEPAEIEAFRRAVRESELRAYIRQETASWQPASGRFKGFEIVY